MAATFPNGIASFPTHRNLTDDVDASHINRIQEEIVAIQSTLGALVNEFDELESEVTVLEGEVNEVEDDVEDLEGSLALNAYKDEQSQKWDRKQFANLKERIARIEKGHHIPVAELHAPGPFFVKPYKTNFQNTMPHRVVCKPKSAAHDPNKMYNGVGITLKKSGFWLIHGWVRYDVDYGNNDGTKNKGIYQAALEYGGHWTTGMARIDVTDKDKIWPNVHLNAIRLQWFPAGAKITLRTSQSSEIKQRVFDAHISATLIRQR